MSRNEADKAPALEYQKVGKAYKHNMPAQLSTLVSIPEQAELLEHCRVRQPFHIPRDGLAMWN